MADLNKYEVIIIGGSYSGLSAAMALGRSLRRVLIIDGGEPCNQQTPHSHNFITQDGEKPSVIAEKAKEQVLNYDTIKFHQGYALRGEKTESGFKITTRAGEEFSAKKLLFATGVKDQMPDIPGFSESWGISVIHCPYCHGYEVKNQKTGILANGDVAYHYAQLITNWTNDLSIYTNGKATLSEEQREKIAAHNIPIVEKDILEIKHKNGQIEKLIFNDGSEANLRALYARPDMKQHCDIPQSLGCEINEQGLIKVDMFQKTSLAGIFACGDNSSPLRAVSHAVASGTIAASILNHELIEAEF